MRNYSAESAFVYETVPPPSSACHYGATATHIDFQDYIKSWSDGNVYRTGKLQVRPYSEYERETKQSIYMGLMPHEGRVCRNIYGNTCPPYATIGDVKKSNALSPAASSSSTADEENLYVDISVLMREPTKFSHQLGERVSSCLPTTSTGGHQQLLPGVGAETEARDCEEEFRVGDVDNDCDNNQKPCIESQFDYDNYRTQIVESEVPIESEPDDRLAVDESDCKGLCAEGKIQQLSPDEYEEFKPDAHLYPYSYAYKPCHMTFRAPQSEVVPTALVPVRNFPFANRPMRGNSDFSPATPLALTTSPPRVVHDIVFFTVKSGQQAKLDLVTVNVPEASRDVEVGWSRNPSDFPGLSSGQRALTCALHCLPHGANFQSPLVVALDVPDTRGDVVVWYSPTDVGQTPVWEKWSTLDPSRRGSGEVHRSDSNRALHLGRWRKVVLLLHHLCSFVVVENISREKSVAIEVFLKTHAIDSRSVIVIIKTTLGCDQRKMIQKAKSLVKEGYRKVENVESILYQLDQKSTVTIAIRDLVLMTGSIKRKQIDPMTHSSDVAWGGAVVLSQFWAECTGIGSANGHLAFTVSMQQEGQTDNSVRAFCSFRAFHVSEERRRYQDGIQKSESEGELRLMSDSCSNFNDEICRFSDDGRDKESSLCALLGQGSKVEGAFNGQILYDDDTRTAAVHKEQLEASDVCLNSISSISKDVEKTASLKRNYDKEIAENRPIVDRIMAVMDLSDSADRTELEQDIRGLYP